MLIKISIYKLLLLISLFSPYVLPSESLSEIIDEIKQLESKRDPKCYATASRLEDFMFGTPLNHQARFRKNILQKEWIKLLWTASSKEANTKGKSSISSADLANNLKRIFSVSKDVKQHWLLSYNDGMAVKIHATDKRQYSSIAYSLRAVLAVQQESLLDFNLQLLPLEEDGLELLTENLDLFTLSVLKLSDVSARKQNKKQVDEKLLQSIWQELLNERDSNQTSITRNEPISNAKKIIAKEIDLTLIRNIIDQKVASYAAYNNLSNKVFNRNLQVYFARVNLPKDEDTQKEFSQVFTSSMIQFAFDLYKESERIALQKNHSMILEEDVFQLLQEFIPHQVDEFEDTTFFYNLNFKEQIRIESYDADSFRDNSAHWRFLKYAINSKNLKPKLQADPFALELIAENIALFGVLSLKMAGIEAKKDNADYLLKRHYEKALVRISGLVKSHLRLDSQINQSGKIVSLKSEKPINENDSEFTPVTTEYGISIEHRTSDWLNRLLRSFLEKKKGVGVLFIPPAFGGSGIAAEDVDNDGFTDLLILSGGGNKLYKNKNGKEFVDVTKSTGIDWLREKDNFPGEPRQPLIADLNNDGLQDIVITYVDDTHRVYQNLGGFKFKDVTKISNLGGEGLVGGPATVFDYDNDGDLDLYITYFGNYIKGVLPTLKRDNDNGISNRLFTNMGNFVFKDVTNTSGVGNTGWTQAVSHTDFNNDGWQDLIVGNDFGINAYYQNNKDGSFTDVAQVLGTDKASYSMNVGIADLNQDLIPDIYISNIVVMNKDEKYVAPNEDTLMKFDSKKLANMRVIEANDLFMSGMEKGQVNYQLSDAVGRGYSSTGWSWDADFFDYDNDGDSDLYVLNGMNEFNVYSSENPYFTDANNNKVDAYIPVYTKESNVFFENKNGRLENQSKKSGLDLLGNSRSAAYLDFDRDGDLDIALNNFNEAAELYRNNLKQDINNWIKIKLIGNVNKSVNRDAIGAKIIITTRQGDNLWREVHGSIGYMSVHPKIQHFGLGNQDIAQIKILWPNGEEQIINSIEVNYEYVINQSKKPLKVRVGS